jgi:hypothetical protein
MTNQAVILQTLVDRQAISDVLFRYCRGADRHDRRALISVYWPEAIDDHIAFVGNAASFIDFSLDFMPGIRTSHLLSNILVEFDNANSARVESYFRAYHDLPTATGGREDWILGGRYLDRFEKRADEWRIIHRVVAIDFQQSMPSTAVWGQGVLAALKTRGDHHPNDPLYRLGISE